MAMGSNKKVAIVTGANTGIGRETALYLAKYGMKVFMACRNGDKGHEAALYIRKSCPGADVEVLLVDLKSLESVRKCASEFKSRNQALHLLVNNAGGSHGTPWYTAGGIGGCAQVNYLGHYVFTRLLKDNLVAGAPSRVVMVSSVLHRYRTIPDPEMFLRDFDAGRYPQAKLALVLFTFELQRRWQMKGIQACAVDPGAVASDIFRGYKKPPWSLIQKFACKYIYAPTWDGAKPVYYAATTSLKSNHDETPFRFFARGGFAWSGVTKAAFSHVNLICAILLDWRIRYLSRGWLFSKVVEVPATPQAYDETLASKLWDFSADVASLPH